MNPETWAIARSDLMINGHDPARIVLGNSFTADGFTGQHFDYMLANPTLRRGLEEDRAPDQGRGGAPWRPWPVRRLAFLASPTDR